jgi:hypothetical protein
VIRYPTFCLTSTLSTSTGPASGASAGEENGLQIISRERKKAHAPTCSVCQPSARCLAPPNRTIAPSTRLALSPSSRDCLPLEVRSSLNARRASMSESVQQFTSHLRSGLYGFADLYGRCSHGRKTANPFPALSVSSYSPGPPRKDALSACPGFDSWSRSWPAGGASAPGEQRSLAGRLSSMVGCHRLGGTLSAG